MERAKIGLKVSEERILERELRTKGDLSQDVGENMKFSLRDLHTGLVTWGEGVDEEPNNRADGETSSQCEKAESRGLPIHQDNHQLVCQIKDAYTRLDRDMVEGKQAWELFGKCSHQLISQPRRCNETTKTDSPVPVVDTSWNFSRSRVGVDDDDWRQ